MQDWNVALERLRGAYADATIEGYRKDFALFVDWCLDEGLSPVPASPETVVRYLDDHIVRLKANTLTRRVAAIVRVHRLLGFPNPKNDEEVRLALRRAKRYPPARPRQAHGITRDLRARMVESCGNDLKGLRDRALVALGFEGLCRRSEISALSVEDLVENMRGGTSVLVRRGKADQEGQGRSVPLSSATARAVFAWIEAAALERGPLICPVYRGCVVRRRLRGFSVSRILKRIAAEAGLDADVVAEISGHSLRVGAAQTLATDGRSVLEIMRVGGWRSINTVSRYIENADIAVWQ